MKKLFLITIATALIMGTTGCASVFARSKGTQSGLYPGVKEGKEAIEGAHGIAGIFVKPVAIADLPFTFALDRGLLPIDILLSVFKGKEEEPSPRIGSCSGALTPKFSP